MRAEPAPLPDPVSALFPAPRRAAMRGTGPLCTMVVDAEEAFDWTRPLPGTRHSTANLHNLDVLHDILDTYGLVPAYLLTYPMLADEAAVRTLRRLRERGRCVLGVQLHTWVTPPFEGEGGTRMSYSGNLSASLEERKLVALRCRFVERFGTAPTVFRNGRYGFGTRTAGLLEEHGFEIDTSVAPRTDFRAQGGPDYTGLDCIPFRFGTGRRLLELPLCRSVVGWGGDAGTAAYRALTTRRTAARARRTWLGALLTRAHCAERITLSPEGNDLGAMRRLVRGLLARGQPLLALSFHSSSMTVGGSPYVQSRAELHEFYDRLSGILDDLAGRGCRFTDILHVADHLEPEPVPA